MANYTGVLATGELPMHYQVALQGDSSRGYLYYQKYYLEGFRQLESVRLKQASQFSTKLRKLNKLVPWYVRSTRSVANHVGRYQIRSSATGLPVKVAIDAGDHRNVRETDAYQWSDIYFKTNYWPSIDYASKVKPLLNGNGTLDQQKLAYIKSLRDRPATHDLIYWTKIWEPGAYSPKWEARAHALIEHQIQLFEALARLECKKNLLVIFTHRLKYANIEDCIKRLEAAGVPWQWGWGNISSQALWDNLASAQVVLLRPGNHLCVSWRMIDLLCMGACIVYDGAPYPQWYRPLESDIHYVDGGCRLGPDYSLPTPESYPKLISNLESLLRDQGRITRIKKNAGDYFDDYATPRAVAAHVLKIAAGEG